MVTLLGRFRQAERRRSSTLSSPRSLASLKAFLTVVPDTPARAATWSMVRVQRPCLTCSADTTAKTACSARVNRQARAGGMAPEEAHLRLLSMEAGVLGREPKRLCAGLGMAGRALLSSMASDRADASASLTCPAEKAFQSS